MEESKIKCQYCDNEADSECISCEEPVCCQCTMAYSQFNQIDYTLCKSCYITQKEEAAGYYNHI